MADRDRLDIALGFLVTNHSASPGSFFVRAGLAIDTIGLSRPQRGGGVSPGLPRDVVAAAAIACGTPAWRRVERVDDPVRPSFLFVS